MCVRILTYPDDSMFWLGYYTPTSLGCLEILTKKLRVVLVVDEISAMQRNQILVSNTTISACKFISVLDFNLIEYFEAYIFIHFRLYKMLFMFYRSSLNSNLTFNSKFTWHFFLPLCCSHAHSKLTPPALQRQKNP